MPLLVFAGGLLFYLASMAPTLLWGDDAELQRIVVTGEARITGQSSRASHLLWLAITSWFVRVATWLPLDGAGRTTLVSVVFGAAALPLIYSAAAELSVPMGLTARSAGLAAALAFGLAHTFWLLAARPDVYTLEMALVAAALWAVLRGRRMAHPGLLAAAALAVALALLNHVIVLASVPGLALLALAVGRRQRRRLIVAAGVSLVVAGAALGVALAAGAPLEDLARVLAGYRPRPPLLRDALLIPVYLVYQFPVAILLAVPGLLAAWRRDRSALVGLLVIYAGNVALVAFQHAPGVYVRDQFIFFLPSYLPVALLIGLGAAALLDGSVWQSRLRLPESSGVRRAAGWAVWVALAAPLAVYPVAALTAGALATRLSPARNLPGRDPVLYYLLPPKTGYTGARAYAESALRALPPDAAVVADWLPYQTLRYMQVVEQQRADLLLTQINAGNRAQITFLLDHAGQRPLYLADASPYPYYEMAEIERCFDVRPESVVYRVTLKAAPAAECHRP